MAHDSERYARQILFAGIGQAGQEKLARAYVVLVGCGADGSLIADRLVRAGVGRLTIIDRDFVELSNLQRQVLFDEADAATRLPKAVAAERKLLGINSDVTVRGLVADLNPENAEELLGDADLVMDGTDNFATRYLINDVCVKHRIPWVYCGVVASYGMTMTILPHQTPCLRCVFPEAPMPGSTPTCDTVGIVNPIVSVVAGIAVAEGIKCLVGTGTVNRGIIYVDLWHNTYDVLDSGDPRPDCPTCGQGRFEYLEAPPVQASSLCGRNAVQVRLSQGPLDWTSLVERLRASGLQVTENA
ncbi:MAG: ThiF family adenylyltransferase, partial [Anaerolineae bacterium]|nr:ThiF family adenylyltransferase [Anaerolineae bacterium]MDW8071578.1 ThiF family adenylyltransferase [Anaerolineae bacterium]